MKFAYTWILIFSLMLAARPAVAKNYSFTVGGGLGIPSGLLDDFWSDGPVFHVQVTRHTSWPVGIGLRGTYVSFPFQAQQGRSADNARLIMGELRGDYSLSSPASSFQLALSGGVGAGHLRIFVPILALPPTTQVSASESAFSLSTAITARLPLAGFTSLLEVGLLHIFTQGEGTRVWTTSLQVRFP